ncbi:MAG: MucR family transcriptional regulator [Neomegalonema sp.]|nr:MucR family transcriptional regulator [Neomegalonema sp.]
MSEPIKSENKSDLNDLLQLTSTIVSSHVSNNPVAQTDLPPLIKSVFSTLQELSVEEPEEPEEELKPAVPIKKSVTNDYIVCLEDGKQLKMLKRHLKSAYNMTPEEYRQRWSLPADYPMVAPSYAQKRQELAKKIGLGRNRNGRG